MVQIGENDEAIATTETSKIHFPNDSTITDMSMNNQTDNMPSFDLTNQMASISENILDSIDSYSSVLDNTLAVDASNQMPIRLPQERKDSSGSDDTASTSSDEMFSSAYTDTVSSLNSLTPLIKVTESDDEIIQDYNKENQEVYDNEGCQPSEFHTTLEEKENNIEEIAPLIDFSNEICKIVIEDMENTDGTLTTSAKNESSTEIENYVPHHLVTIEENEVVSSFVTEVEPSIPYTQITDKLVYVDESFLNVSQNSLWDVEQDKHKKHGTMLNIHERSSFTNLTDVSKVGLACQKALLYLRDDINFGSVASLNSMANKQLNNYQENIQSPSLISGSKFDKVVTSRKYTKNLLALSLITTLLFTAIGSVRNLQSSLNHEGGVGIISLAVSFVGYMLGSVFSMSAMQTYQPKTCILLALIPHLLYIAANVYPAIWILVPMSFLQGISMAVLWNGVSTYITFLAHGKAVKNNIIFEQISAKYFGIFCLVYQSHLIIGNLIASLVLMKDVSSRSMNVYDNDTYLNSSLNNNNSHIDYINQSLTSLRESNNSAQVCGSGFCPHHTLTGSGFAVKDETKYLLYGIYFGFVVISIVIAFFMLERLNTGFERTVSYRKKIKCQLKSLSKFFITANFLMLTPLLMYSVIQFGFITAEFTKAFITCPFGIHMVGYTMICFGVCGGLSSFASGLFTKLIGRTPQFIFAGVLNLGSLVFMLQLKPSPADSVFIYFAIMGVWGFADGIWMSQVNSLMGIVFPDKCEEAYAGLRVAQGLGVAISFSYSNSLCMTYKIYILGVLCVIGLCGYIAMELCLKIKSQIKLIKQTSV